VVGHDPRLGRLLDAPRPMALMMCEIKMGCGHSEILGLVIGCRKAMQGEGCQCWGLQKESRLT
jgi:hypothetical protein